MSRDLLEWFEENLASERARDQNEPLFMTFRLIKLDIERIGRVGAHYIEGWMRAWNQVMVYSQKAYVIEKRGWLLPGGQPDKWFIKVVVICQISAMKLYILRYVSEPLVQLSGFN